MSAWLSVAITVILIVVVFLILNRNINARTSQQAALDEIKREVGAIITELNATTERNIELIEDRIATLEKLLEQADRKVGALRRDLAVHDASGLRGSTYDRLGRPASDAGTPSRAPHQPDRPSGQPDRDAAAPGAPRPGHDRGSDDGAEAFRDRSTGESETDHDSPESFFVSRAGNVRQEHRSADPATARTTLRDRVRGLYLQGLSLERIASVVGKTVGEVELIVSLEEGNER